MTTRAGEQPKYLSTRRNSVLREDHLWIAEQALGKALPESAVVHHVDGNGQNNKNNNLVICENQGYHKLLHRRTEALRVTGNARARKCEVCKKWAVPNEGDFVVYPRSQLINSDGRAFHRKCHSRYNTAWKTAERSKQ